MLTMGDFGVRICAILLSLQADALPDAVSLIKPQEPGERLEFEGRVLDMDGRPLSRVAVVAYNADASGLYNPPHGNTRVPRIRGAAVTDAQGRFRFLTVRPEAYPDQSQPAHIHLIVAAPAHHVKYVEFWFEGDPLITDALRQEAARSGTSLIVTLNRRGERWHFEHDIRLSGN